MLTPPLPLRSVAIAAALAVVGALVAVVAAASGWSGVVVALGVVLMVAAVALMVWSWLGWQRMRVSVEVDDTGYTITGPDGEQSGQWHEVTKLAQTPTTLVIYHGPDRRVRLVSARGVTAEMVRLSADLVRRLDVSRGYTNQS